MRGEDAARIFYGGDRFTRKRAVPRPTLTLLQDFGSAAGLDGEAHRHRKAMFMKLMGRDQIGRLGELAAREWQAAIDAWEAADEVVIQDSAQEILCRAVCAWSGVPLAPSEVEARARDLAAMFDGAGSVGPRQIRGQFARARGERWIEAIIDDIRAGRLHPDDDRPAQVIASHRELDGRLLDSSVATVELLNILRPGVAVARFVTFAALALHEHPGHADRLRGGDEQAIERFVQEVRRYYAFFPLISGRATRDVEWRGHLFREGDWVMLDLYGTNHDPRRWEDPGRFDPERFRDWDGSPFGFIPQGGGDFHTDHRCAGEWATIELLKVAVRHLTTQIDYDVPDQDLRISRSRMPARPRSGVRIRNVRRRG